jgi:hypothetical protein
VFKSIPLPWFSAPWSEKMQDITGEDWFFAERAEAHGIPMHIDHELSKQVGHIGPYTYTHNDVVEDEVRGTG